ncbi:fimbria/pilus periplasmic chaperone [Paraburkholderia sp. Tr-20389]|uniref:fimbria/pilus periplasmic chaperone n=1 Tax=Paraburkholderia sp. Tr-20389 TaxID=2703903 RepID=UPI00197F09AE|nr:fimbria/pilus periplasmic chaperone [Paraburkholderia sp. Tr-20389]MBN3758566.1 fimbria/pilus periplasmic chaperone [Paraburkholderia sp. Tr-20389]
MSRQESIKEILKIAIILLVTTAMSAAAVAAAQFALEVDRTHLYLDESLPEDTVVVRNKSNSPLFLRSSVQGSGGASPAPVVVRPLGASISPGDTAVIHVRLTDPVGEEESLFQLQLEWQLSSDSGTSRAPRQLNVPLLVHPMSLPRQVNPWLYIRFRMTVDGRLYVDNTGPYVLPVSPLLEFAPEKRAFGLPKALLLPHESVFVSGVFPNLKSNAVSITPTDLSGKLLPKIELPLERGS